VSYLNVAIFDGEHAVVSRFTDADDGVPESLYYFTGQLYPDVGTRAKRKGTQAVTVSSERLTRLEHRYRPRDGRADARYWMIVPNSSPIPAVAAIASAPQSVTRPAAAAT
jgi:hypothetical protein